MCIGVCGFITHMLVCGDPLRSSCCQAVWECAASWLVSDSQQWTLLPSSLHWRTNLLHSNRTCCCRWHQRSRSFWLLMWNKGCIFHGHWQWCSSVHKSVCLKKYSMTYCKLLQLHFCSFIHGNFWRCPSKLCYGFLTVQRGAALEPPTGTDIVRRSFMEVELSS